MLHGDGHDEAPEEHVVGGVEIVDGDLSCTHTTRYMSPVDSGASHTCGHDPQQRQQHHRHHGGDGQGQGLRQPVGRHLKVDTLFPQ